MLLMYVVLTLWPLLTTPPLTVCTRRHADTAQTMCVTLHNHANTSSTYSIHVPDFLQPSEPGLLVQFGDDLQLTRVNHLGGMGKKSGQIAHAHKILDRSEVVGL